MDVTATTENLLVARLAAMAKTMDSRRNFNPPWCTLMPFTPFHMGPGAAIKAVSGPYFSLVLFGFAQVLIDLEPLVRMVRGDMVLHGYTHTYLGATGIGLLAYLLGRPLCGAVGRGWNRFTRPGFFDWLRLPEHIPRTAAATGAFVGTYSHVFLDSFMHADMRPFAPFSAENGLLDAIPLLWLHLGCVVLGVVGAMVWFVLWVWKKIAIEV